MRFGRGVGTGAEALVELVCVRYEQDGRAMIRRAHPATTQDREGRRVFTGGGLPDFVGWLPGVGRGVLFDCKSTRTGRFRWPDRARGKRTKERQLDDLERAGRDYNVLAGLLVVFWAVPLVGAKAGGWTGTKLVGDRMAWVPWWHVRSAAVGISWTPDQLCARLGVPVEWPADRDPDFLRAALDHERLAGGAQAVLARP